MHMEAFDGESHGDGKLRAKDDWNCFDALLKFLEHIMMSNKELGLFLNPD